MKWLTLDEKLGQLFIVRAYGTKDSQRIKSIEQLIRTKNIGGLCFFQGDAETQADLTNYFQSISKVPLFISMDAEWSLGMRLKTDGFSYPKQMCLGAIKDNRLIYEMGVDIGRQLKRIGVNLNFAPVVDINSNPRNPVINERSFGEDRLNVSAKAYAYMLGMQNQNVLSCAKHFPGHGDTDVDSHLELPILNHNMQRMDSVELFPFKILSEMNVASIMIAHLFVPSISTQDSLASSMSNEVVHNLLRNEMNYKGLIITDALEMKAVAKKFPNGELELMCYKAGNDILLLSENLDSAIEKIKNAILEGQLTIEDLNKRVERILVAKYDAQLNILDTIEKENLKKEIFTKKSLAIKEKLYRNAVTLVKDEYNEIPFRDLEQKFVSISFGSSEITEFQNKLSKYTRFNSYTYEKLKDTNPIEIKAIAEAQQVVISLHKLNYKFESNYGLSQSEIEFINQISKFKKLTLCIFGTPYVAKFFPNVSAIVICYENNAVIQNIGAELIFGTDPIKGILPVQISDELLLGKGIIRPSLMRLGYSIPEAEGFNSDSLSFISIIANQLIQSKAAPGCQILIAKNNKIVYSENFGSLNYDSSQFVSQKTIYDIASLTKITASAPCLMKLTDENFLELNDSISDYLEEFKGTNKQGLIIRDALLHQARLLSWIPYYKSTLISPDTLNILDSTYYRNEFSDSFDIQVADHLYLRHTYKDSILYKILQSRLHDTKKYLYSDLFFYFVPMLVERLTGEFFYDYLDRNFYKPLGMNSTSFQQYCELNDKNLIAPSEVDEYFRHQEIKGNVHDMGSAMCGGVSGHAGIFTNAENLAILMQCYLNSGNYGGREYFSNSVVRQFASRDRELGRRGLIFDLPEEQNSETAYVSNLAPKTTFGHTGFTGTCAWADPVNNIIFIFLSNRTYPNGSINLLHKMRYRVKIQDTIYKSLIN
ncbi:MAG: glycoside hydrolase family 3 N-terminal domain-containing protein [Saprospiraceae bacterium]